MPLLKKMFWHSFFSLYCTACQHPAQNASTYGHLRGFRSIRSYWPALFWSIRNYWPELLCSITSTIFISKFYWYKNCIVETANPRGDINLALRLVCSSCFLLFLVFIISFTVYISRHKCWTNISISFFIIDYIFCLKILF